MPSTAKTAPASRAAATAKQAPARDAQAILEVLKRQGTKAGRDAMARYAIPSDRAFGVPVGALLKLAKPHGRDHELAAALWATGWYEARMMATYIDNPAQVTATQMDRWCEEFGNWAICDTACFKLFDRTPHAWKKVEQWSRKRDEIGRRAAFALLWSLTVHDPDAADAQFIKGLALIEAAATDDRNFVKKAVNMALRAVGKRNLALNAAATKTAQRLAASGDATARWIGTDALRELTSAALGKRLAASRRAAR